MRHFVSTLPLVALLAACGGEAAAPTATAPVVAAPAAPPTFACCADAKVDSVVGAYVDVQAALAKDDNAGAATSLTALTALLAATTAAKAETTLDAESAAFVATIEAETTAAAAAADIAARRTAMKKVSAAAIPLAKKHPGGSRTLSEAYCPMADASWLQTGTTIANPYYGSEMLTCGSFK